TLDPGGNRLYIESARSETADLARLPAEDGAGDLQRHPPLLQPASAAQYLPRLGQAQPLLAAGTGGCRRHNRSALIPSRITVHPRMMPAFPSSALAFHVPYSSAEPPSRQPDRRR